MKAQNYICHNRIVLHTLIPSFFVCYLEDFNSELSTDKLNLTICELALAECFCNNNVEKSIITFLINKLAWSLIIIY